MSLLRLKYLLLGLLVLFIMSFLYVKTQAVDLDKHNQLLDKINQFKQADAVLNQHILEIHHGLLPFYDPTVSKITRLDQLQIEVGQLLNQLHLKQPTIIQDLEQIDQVLEQKVNLLENFKSSNALLYNSLRYLPKAMAQIIAQLPSGKQADILKHTLHIFLRDILIYNMNNDVELGETLKASSKKLMHEINKNSINHQDELSVLLTHINIVLTNKKQTDRAVQNLISMPVTTSVDELLRTYIAIHKLQMQSINNYRLSLYSFSLLLLAFITYILLKLRLQTIHLKKTEIESRKSTARLRGVLDSALDAIVSMDSDGAIIDWNPQAETIFGWTCQEVLGKQLEDIIMPNYVYDSDMQGLQRFFKNKDETILGDRIEIMALHRSGHEFSVELTISRVTIDDDFIFSAFIRDITNRLKAVEALRESERYNRMLFDQSSMGLALCRMSGELVDINSAYADIIGRTVEETMQLTYWDITPEKYTEDEERQLNCLNKTGHYGPYEKEYIHSNGQLVPVRLQGMLVHKHGEQMIWSSIEDITEHRQMEEALRRSQKMDAIGQLSGGIAHDFNNQLGVIIGYLDFLQIHTAQDEKPHKWVETAIRATLRCMDLTRQLLAFSRKQNKATSVVNINTMFNDLETMIARSLTPEVEIQYCLAENLWRTEIDPGEFQDAILNLVINARDAMVNGGKLLIETNNIYLDEDYISLNPEADTGNYVQLVLSDTGAGMDKETQEHIFEPFFTTKPAGRGTGLGLAMVYGFVKRYGGYIKVYSELGVGTSMRLYLPRSSADESVIQSNDAAEAQLPKGHESILIVDDEVDLLQLAEQYLTDLGYRTSIAENAAQALDILASGQKFDLLFSDVVMPGGMNGYELAQQAVQQHSNLKVLLTSGFTSKSIAHNGLARFASNLLNKPYRKIELAKQIRLVLDSENIT